MKIVFMGTPAAAAVSLERLLAAGHEVVAVYTQPDRPSGRGNRIVFSPVKELATSAGIPVYQPLKIKTTEAFDEFRSLGADIAVVVAYGRILPETFLGAFRFGALNVHFSLLPKYRGAAPVNWAIVNGEQNTGVTTMRMDAGLDTGDIYQQAETSIGSAETAPELMSRLAELGADVLIDTLTQIDKITPIPQIDDAASFAPIMKREDGEVNWLEDAVRIERRVRGFQPFPGSYSFYNGLKVVFWSVEAVSGKPGAAAGDIIEAGNGKLIVAAGNNSAVSVNEIQMEGKRRMHIRDLLNGTHMLVGESFRESEKKKVAGS